MAFKVKRIIIIITSHYQIILTLQGICNNCERINKIENKKCFFCGYDNNSYLKNININLANNIIKNIKKHKQKKSNSNKNIVNKNISLTQRNENKLKINQLGEIEDEYRNIDQHVLKYFDMPMAYVPQSNIKNEIKIPRQSPKLSGKIPSSYNINNNSNNSLIINNVKSSNMTNNKINFIKNKKELMKMNTPQLILNSESNTIENNILNTINPNDNVKRNFNIIHKKRNSNSDNIINNNNYY